MAHDGSEILFGKRQTPLLMKTLDDMASEVNTKIRKRGISKGFVCVQEDFNRQILQCHKNIYSASVEKIPNKRIGYIENCQKGIKMIWIDIRYLLTQKALTVGEIGVLSKMAKDAEKQLYAWHKETYKS